MNSVTVTLSPEELLALRLALNVAEATESGKALALHYKFEAARKALNEVLVAEFSGDLDAECEGADAKGGDQAALGVAGLKTAGAAGMDPKETRDRSKAGTGTRTAEPAGPRRLIEEKGKKRYTVYFDRTVYFPASIVVEAATEGEAREKFEKMTQVLGARECDEAQRIKYDGDWGEAASSVFTMFPTTSEAEIQDIHEEI